MKIFIIGVYPFYKTLVPKNETIQELLIMDVRKDGVSIRPLGDSALVVQLADGIDSIIHKRIIKLVNLIEREPFCGMLEAVPCYNSVTVYYNPIALRKDGDIEGKNAFEKASASINCYLKKLDESPIVNKRLIEIPVVYGERFGPDLEYIAKYHNITPEKVIELHAKKDYLVYMIGFAPGFPYLGEIDERLATPRKAKPRPAIPAGSVGIAGEQTGIYSLETPGGWQVIGQTPVDLFTPKASRPTLLESGDEIRFVPITEDEYFAYKEKN